MNIEFINGCLKLSQSIIILTKQIQSDNSINENYYQQLAGILPANAAINYVSIDDGITYPLTMETLLSNPKTHRELLLQEDYYNDIVSNNQKYRPYIVNLLFGRPYGREELIAMDNYSILGHNSTLIEKQEITLLDEIEAWLKEFGNKLINPTVTMVEEYSPALSMSAIYSMLPATIARLRINKIGTHEVSEILLTDLLEAKGVSVNRSEQLNYRTKRILYSNLDMLLREDLTNENIAHVLNILGLGDVGYLRARDTQYVDNHETTFDIVSVQNDHVLTNVDTRMLLNYTAIGDGSVAIANSNPDVDLSNTTNSILILMRNKADVISENLLYTRWGHMALADKFNVDITISSNSMLYTMDAKTAFLFANSLIRRLNGDELLPSYITLANSMTAYAGEQIVYDNIYSLTEFYTKHISEVTALLNNAYTRILSSMYPDTLQAEYDLKLFRESTRYYIASYDTATDNKAWCESQGLPYIESSELRNTLSQIMKAFVNTSETNIVDSIGILLDILNERLPYTSKIYTLGLDVKTSYVPIPRAEATIEE